VGAAVNDARLDCPHAARCPGCPGIALDREAQRAAKTARLDAAVARFAELASSAREPIVAPEPAVGYRTRTKWVADEAGRLGLYARGTHEVVDLRACGVLSPALTRVIEALRAVREGCEALWPRVLRGIDARETIEGGHGVLLTLTYGPGDVPDASSLAHAEVELERALASDGGPPLAVSLSVAERDRTPRVLGTYRIDPTRARLDRIGEGPPFLAAHGAFVQAHRGTAAAIHVRIVREVTALGPAPRVVELYAGSGALALRLASAGASVVAVERFAPAIELLQASAERAGLAPRVRAIVADAVEALADPALRAAEVVVVNPPRRGLPASVRDAVARSAARLVVYVACDPETLARDLAAFARVGLAASALAPFDMMPQTLEVETVAVLRRAAPPAPTVLAQAERWVVVDKAPHEPTTPHPEHVVCLLDRVRRLPGFERATPVHRLDVGTSGACLFARTPEDVPPLQRALSEADKTYVALVRGIPREKGTVRRPLREQGREQPATTRYRRLRVVAGHGLVEARPEQGRMHQIRRHLASIGHPIVCDARHGHGPTNRHFEESAALDRPFLHCATLRITLDGMARTVEAPLAPDLRLVLDRLGG
jgi:23S rRNA (uracil1939-C5)-methyltransferase